MGDLEKGVKNSSIKTNEEQEEEEEQEERLMEVLDFDLLCSTVALQTQGRWTKLHTQDFCEPGNGSVFRMWEGELLDCCHNRRIAIQSFCCPCYRFGKNMRRAGLDPCFLQGIVYYIITLVALLSFIAFVVSKRLCFLYLSLGFTISMGIYLGFFRTQMRKKFNIRYCQFPHTIDMGPYACLAKYEALNALLFMCFCRGRVWVVIVLWMIVSTTFFVPAARYARSREHWR